MNLRHYAFIWGIIVTFVVALVVMRDIHTLFAHITAQLP